MERVRAADDGSSERRLLEEFTRTRAPAALDALVERYRPLARSLALRYRGGSEPLEDLVQVAELGLVKAIGRFDPSLGKPFTAYAVPTILGELKRHFRDRVWNVRLPRGLQETSARVLSARDRLTERTGRTPTAREIADELEIEVDEALEALAAAEARYTASLDAPRGADPEAPALIDRLGRSEAGYERVETNLAAHAAVLDTREHRVLRLRFEDGLTQDEIGERIGVSQMQVSRISRRGLRKLLDAVQGAAEPA